MQNDQGEYPKVDKSGGVYAPPIDWKIESRNQEWHETYFAPKAVKDHQAKGSCEFYMKIIEYMEEQGWLKPGDVILDPMCGIGTTLILGALNGYDTVGIELEKKYYDDMLGYDEVMMIDDGLLPPMRSHIEGSIERFRKITADVKAVGKIHVINGDARKADELIEQANSAVCSPPYGNRFRDVAQQIGEKALWGEGFREENRDQYSDSPDNIGNDKIQVISSPPYSSTTEIGGSKGKYQPEHEYSEENLALNPLRVISSPPYSRANEHSKEQLEGYFEERKADPYTYENTKNIALLDESAYTREMRKVYEALYRIPSLEYVALITRDFIQEGKIVQLFKLTAKLMARAGFYWIDTKRAELPDLSFFKIINHKNFHEAKGLPLITWEEVTFYRRKENERSES